MSTFEIVDRRGGNKPEEKVEIVDTIIEAPAEERGEWKSIYLYFTPLQVGMTKQGPIIANSLRAAGLRHDDRVFVADYLLTHGWEHPERWEIEVRKRLDTFLNCECTNSGPCAVHKILLQQWGPGDLKRLDLESGKPLPLVMEKMNEIEKSHQKANLVVPRG